MAFADDFHLVEKHPDGIHEWQHHAGSGTVANPYCLYLVYKGIWFTPDTPRDLIPFLARRVSNGVRLRWWYGDYGKNTVWHDTYDVSGLLSVSRGPIHSLLSVYNRKSSAGSLVLTGSIRAMIDSPLQFIWLDDKFRRPVYEIRSDNPLGIPALPVNVFSQGENVRNFKTVDQAKRWVDFMTGRRMVP